LTIGDLSRAPLGVAFPPGLPCRRRPYADGDHCPSRVATSHWGRFCAPAQVARGNHRTPQQERSRPHATGHKKSDPAAASPVDLPGSRALRQRQKVSNAPAGLTTRFLRS